MPRTRLAAALAVSALAISMSPAADQDFWSLRPPVRQAAPAIRDARNGAWARQPLDRFILARLETEGVAPSPEAEARDLYRRLSFDLLGLPPSPEEVEAFLADAAPNRYDLLVERLLASPRFGERLASLWLPLARYAEDQAHQVGDDTKFFYPHAYRYREWVIDAFNRDVPYDRFIQLQLAADILKGADTLKGAGEGDLPALGFLGLGPKYYNRDRLEVQADEWEDRVDTVTRTFLGLTVACARCHDHKFDPIATGDYYAIAGVFASTKMVNKTPAGTIDKADKASKMDPATLHIVEDGEAKDLNVFIRGNPQSKGPLAKRGFLHLLSKGDPAPFQEGSGRRELAEAIASPKNPLTARVLVNRVWGHLFGRPLSPTPSNFGRSGAPPSHPELLDDLAVRFMEGGWSVKALVREMVLSSTYRQSSRETPAQSASDPGNERLGRMSRRRLAVEQWRDSALYVSGELRWDGGPSQEITDPANLRRTVHARISRLKLDDFLGQFDYPDANVHSERRSQSITPGQKLFMLNSAFILARSKALAVRIEAEAPAGGPARVKSAYRLLFAREPEDAELELGLEFLRGTDAEAGKADMTRWERYAQALLVSNEMMYVD